MSKRFAVLALFVAGCGGGSMTGGDAGSDGSAPDLAMAAQKDLAMAAGITGAACASKADCAGSNPMCIRADAMGNAWPEGYCSASCNENNNDQNDSINPTCPGKGTCSGT